MRRTLILVCTAVVGAVPAPAFADVTADLALAGPTYKIHRAGSGSAYRVVVTNHGSATVHGGLMIFDLTALDRRLTPINAADGTTGRQCEDADRILRCPLPELAARASREFILLVEDHGGLTRGAAGAVSMNVTGDVGDPSPSNNVLRVPWQVSLGLDGRIRVDIGQVSGRVGDVVTVRVTARMIGQDPQRYWGVTVSYDMIGVTALGGSHCVRRDILFECLRKDGIRTGETQTQTLSLRINATNTWTQGAIGGLLDFGTAGQPEGNWGDQTCMIIVLGEKRCTAGGSGPAGGGHASGGPTASTAATPAPTNGATARDTPPPAPPPSVTAQPTDPVATIAEPPRTAAADSSVATADRVVALLGVLVLLTIGVLRRHHRRRPRATSP